MTLAWSYFGVRPVRFFFLWTLVYAENRNMYITMSSKYVIQRDKKYKTQILSVGDWMRPKNWAVKVDQCVCVNFLCWSVLTF